MRKSKLDKQLEKLGYMRIKCLKIPGSYCLYRSGGNHEFVAVFAPVRGKIIFNGARYDTPDEFVKAAEEYGKTLYFPADSYNPDYNKEYVDQFRLEHTLMKCGIDRKEGPRFTTRQVLEDDLGGKFAHVMGTNLMLSDYSWMPMKNDSDPIDETTCEKIKSLLASVYAYHIGVLAGALNNMGKLDRIDSISINTFNPNTLTVETHSGKEAIISKLEEVLAKLKGE
jgi:hypothetical protein